MKVENVNCFIQGAQSTLTAICGDCGKLGKLFVKQDIYNAMPISVVVGIIGSIKGEVIYTMDSTCGLFLASKFMRGMPVDSMDDMAKSAVSELANMISGNACSVLSKFGHTVDITTPTFIMGGEASNFNFMKTGDKVLCMPLELAEGGILEIDLHLET